MTLPALDIRDLKFRYGRSSSPNGWVVDVSQLTLAADDQILLTAGSGRGKSTLLHLVAGLIEPASGSITVNGENVVTLPAAKRDEFRGRHIGMIFQTFNLLHGFTALENVMMAMVVSEVPRREHRARGLELLKELGIEDADARPDRMSVGQQQRVAVARAVACNPAIVLADEPTASLDPTNAAAAMDLMQNACRQHGAALLCTSHDPTMIDRFERSCSLEELAAPGA